MALVIGNATVAIAMSPLVEDALYADEIFRDGVTFSSRYDVGNAGQIQVIKYTPDTSITPGVPGSDFTDTEYSNTVMEINCNNSFQKSVKVPNYFENTIPSNLLVSKTYEVTESLRVGRMKSGIAVLCHDGTEAAYKTALSSVNLKTAILTDRAKLRKKNANPKVVIASVDTYMKMLQMAGTEYTPVMNERMNSTAQVGTWLGMLWLESTILGETNLKYRDSDGAEQPVDTTGIDYIMYDGMAFTIIDKLSMLRVKESEHFMGSKIQEEIDTGFAVTNADCVLVHKTSAEASDEIALKSDEQGSAVVG